VNEIKKFSYEGKIMNYFIKDIDVNLKENKGKEMASALMVICDEKNCHIDTLRVYDEKLKVLYAMPVDAERWYIEYQKEKI